MRRQMWRTMRSFCRTLGYLKKKLKRSKRSENKSHRVGVFCCKIVQVALEWLKVVEIKGELRLAKDKDKKEVDKNNNEDEFCEPFEDDSFDSNQPMLQLLESMNGNPTLRKVYLFGEVNTRSILNVVSQIHLMEADNNEDIEIYINSAGGYVIDCFALVDVMNSSPCDFKTIVIGQAASAACLIASNGTSGKRYAGRNAEFLWHEVFGAIPELRHSEIAFWKRETKRPQEKFNRIFSQNTGRTLKEINDNFYNNKMESYLSAQQAKDFGIIDHLMRHKKREAIVRKVKTEKKQDA